MRSYEVQDNMRRWRRRYPAYVSLIALLCVLALWEAVCRSGAVSPLFLPAPTAILAALVDMIADGEIGDSLAASLFRIAAGFAAGAAAGLITGLVAGTSSLADRAAMPIVNALYPIPKIALLPLFIL